MNLLTRIFKRYSEEPRPLLTRTTPRTFVPRDDFRSIISRALAQTPFFNLSPAEQMKLFDLAENTQQVAYGFWRIEDVGCPIYQCKISRGNSGADDFARVFDSVVYDYLQDLCPSDQRVEPHILVII